MTNRTPKSPGAPAPQSETSAGRLPWLLVLLLLLVLVAGATTAVIAYGRLSGDLDETRTDLHHAQREVRDLEAELSAAGYCSSVGSVQQDFESFEASDFSNFDEFTERVEGLADEAPDEVKDDWKVLADAFRAFVAALENAGLEPADLAGLSDGEIPEGTDLAALQEALTQVQALGTDEVQQATDNIEKHAKDECNLDFTPS